MITNGQKAILHIAKQQLGLDRDQYEAILQAEAGVTSSSSLDNKGFDRVVTRLEELGFVNRGRRTKPRNHRPAAPITPHQQQLIRDLYLQLGWADLARQTGFNQRQVRKPWPQTRRDGNVVIEGLKAILKRQQAAANE